MSEKAHKRPTLLNRDHARPRSQPNPSDPEIEKRLTELVSPLTYALVSQYHNLGLRERILTLPVMVAMVLSLIWRQVPSASELVRMVERDSLLWSPPLNVSQKAFSLRLGSLPDSLFKAVLLELLPKLQDRSAARSRPQPRVVATALRHFGHVWIADGSTLEALFRKVGPLRERVAEQLAERPNGKPDKVLGGKLFGLLDLASKLPINLWHDPDPNRSDLSFLEEVKALFISGSLLLFDLVFYSFEWFDYLTDQKVSFVTRARTISVYDITKKLVDSARVHDYIVQFGKYRSDPCKHPLRLVEVLIKGRWHRYLTNVLDPMLLSTSDVMDLYEQRWRIEDAFLLVKRLLGLSYLWTGSANGIALQIWATWLLYAVLIDLSDQVADRLGLSIQEISFEMVYRGLYHFTRAHSRGQADDPVAYLAAPEQADLGIVKRRNKHRERDRRANRPEEFDPKPNLDNPISLPNF
jgi:Transposase DDE domain